MRFSAPYLETATARSSAWSRASVLPGAPSRGSGCAPPIMREGHDLGRPTLAPIGVLGIQSNQPISDGRQGRYLRLALGRRMDRSLLHVGRFPAQELQSSITCRRHRCLTPIDTTASNEGRLDRASLTANLWLGPRASGFRPPLPPTIPRTRIRESVTFGDALPFVPEYVRASMRLHGSTRQYQGDACCELYRRTRYDNSGTHAGRLLDA